MGAKGGGLEKGGSSSSGSGGRSGGSASRYVLSVPSALIFISWLTKSNFIFQARAKAHLPLPPVDPQNKGLAYNLHMAGDDTMVAALRLRIAPVPPLLLVFRQHSYREVRSRTIPDSGLMEPTGMTITIHIHFATALLQITSTN